MSPVNQLTDPASEETLGAQGAQVLVTYVNGTSTTLKVGELVIASGYSGSGQLKCVKWPTAGSFKILGVVVGGKSPGFAVPSGTIAQICVEGPCQALFKTDSVTGESVIGSAATAGVVKNTTAVLGKTVGFCTQTKTTVSTTTLIWIYVHKM